MKFSPMASSQFSHLTMDRIILCSLEIYLGYVVKALVVVDLQLRRNLSLFFLPVVPVHSFRYLYRYSWT